MKMHLNTAVLLTFTLLPLVGCQQQGSVLPEVEASEQGLQVPPTPGNDALLAQLPQFTGVQAIAAPASLELPEDLVAFAGRTGAGERVWRMPHAIWAPDSVRDPWLSDEDPAERVGAWPNEVSTPLEPGVDLGWRDELDFEVSLLSHYVPGNTVQISVHDQQREVAEFKYGLSAMRLVRSGVVVQDFGEVRSRELLQLPRSDEYPEVLPDVDIAYRIQERDVKHDFVLRSKEIFADYAHLLEEEGEDLLPSDALKVEFVEHIRVSDHLQVIDEWGMQRYAMPVDIWPEERVFFVDDDDSAPLMAFAKPLAFEHEGFDASRLEARLVLDEQGRGTYSVFVPLRWLLVEERRYPVRVDPHAVLGVNQAFLCTARQLSTAGPYRPSGGAKIQGNQHRVRVTWSRLFSEGQTENVTINWGDGQSTTAQLGHSRTNCSPNSSFQSSCQYYRTTTVVPRLDPDAPFAISDPHNNVTEIAWYVCSIGFEHVYADPSAGPICGGNNLCPISITSTNDSEPHNSACSHTMKVQDCRGTLSHAPECGESVWFAPPLGNPNDNLPQNNGFCQTTVFNGNPCAVAGHNAGTTCNHGVRPCAGCQRGVCRNNAGTAECRLEVQTGISCNIQSDTNVCTLDGGGAGVCQSSGECLHKTLPNGTDCDLGLGGNANARCGDNQAPCAQCYEGACLNLGVGQADCRAQVASGRACNLFDDGNSCSVDVGTCEGSGIHARCSPRRRGDFIGVGVNRVCAVPPDTRTHQEQLNYNAGTVLLEDFRCTQDFGHCRVQGNGFATMDCDRVNVAEGTVCATPDEGALPECRPLAQCDGRGGCRAVAEFKCDPPFYDDPLLFEGYDPYFVSHCLNKTCVPGVGCVQLQGNEVPAGTRCNPGAYCRVNGRCDSGVCKDQPRDCATQLQTDLDIPPFGTCLGVDCREEENFRESRCELVVQNEGSSCLNDGIACTVSRCEAGACVNEPNDALCDTGNQCSVGICDPSSGCRDIPVPDGTLCAQNGGTFCEAGACIVDPNCGNGELEGDEECDDGADNAIDGSCLPNCKNAFCGDGAVRLTGDVPEECDDGALNGTGLCTADCRLLRCGDGEVSASIQEQCDPGSDDLSCNPLCLTGFLGDGVVGDGERCDDGPNPADAECGVDRLGECGIVRPGQQPLLEDRFCFDGDPTTLDVCIPARPGTTKCQHQIIASPPIQAGPSSAYLAEASEQLRADAVVQVLTVYEGAQIALVLDDADPDASVFGCACNGLLDADRVRTQDTVRVEWPALDAADGSLRHGAGEVDGAPEQGPVAIYTAPALQGPARTIEVVATLTDSGLGLVDDADRQVVFSITVERRDEAVSLDPAPTVDQRLLTAAEDASWVRPAGACERRPGTGWDSEGELSGSFAPAVAQVDGDAGLSLSLASWGQPILLAGETGVDLDGVQVQCGTGDCVCTQDSRTPRRELRDRVDLIWAASEGEVQPARGLSGVLLPPAGVAPRPGYLDIEVSAIADDYLPGDADDAPVDAGSATLRVVKHFYMGTSTLAMDDGRRYLERLFRVSMETGSYVDESDGLAYGPATLWIEADSLPGLLGGDLAAPDFPGGTVVTVPVQMNGLHLGMQSWPSLDGVTHQVLVADAGALSWAGSRSIRLSDDTELQLHAVSVTAGSPALLTGRFIGPHGLNLRLAGVQLAGNLAIYGTVQPVDVGLTQPVSIGAFAISHDVTEAVIDLDPHRSFDGVGAWAFNDTTLGDGNGLNAVLPSLSDADWGVFLNGAQELLLPPAWGNGLVQGLPVNPELRFGVHGLDGDVVSAAEATAKVIDFDTTFGVSSGLRVDEGSYALSLFDARAIALLGGDERCFRYLARPPTNTGDFGAVMQRCEGVLGFEFAMQLGQFDLTLTDLAIDVDLGGSPAIVPGLPPGDRGVYVREVVAKMPLGWGSPERPELVSGGLQVFPFGFDGVLRIEDETPARLVSMGMDVDILSSSRLRVHVSDESREISGEMALRLHLPGGVKVAPGHSPTVTFNANVDNNGHFVATVHRMPDIDVAPGFRLVSQVALIDHNPGVKMHPFIDAQTDGIGLSQWTMDLGPLLGDLRVFGKELVITKTGLNGRFNKPELRFGTLYQFPAEYRDITIEVRNNIPVNVGLRALVTFEAIDVTAEVLVQADAEGNLKLAALNKDLSLEFDLGRLLHVEADPGRVFLGVDPDGTGFVVFDGNTNIEGMRPDAKPFLLRLEGFKARADGTTSYETLSVLDRINLQGGAMTASRIEISPHSAAAVKRALGDLGMGQFIDGNAELRADLQGFDIEGFLGGTDVGELFGDLSIGRLIGSARVSRMPQNPLPSIPSTWTLRTLLAEVPGGDGLSLWDSLGGQSVGDLMDEPLLAGFTVGQLIGALPLEATLRDMRLREVRGSFTVDPFILTLLQSWREQFRVDRILSSLTVGELAAGLDLTDNQKATSVWSLVEAAGLDEIVGPMHIGGILENLGLSWPAVAPANWRVGQVLGNVPLEDLFEDIDEESCYLGSFGVDEIQSGGQTMRQVLNRYDLEDLIDGLRPADLGLGNLGDVLDPNMNVGAAIVAEIGNPPLGDLLAQTVPTLADMLDSPPDAGACVTALQPGQCLGELQLSAVLPSNTQNQTLFQLINALGAGTVDETLTELMAGTAADLRGLSGGVSEVASCLTGSAAGLNLDSALRGLSLQELMGPVFRDIDLKGLQQAVNATLTVVVEGDVAVGDDMPGGKVTIDIDEQGEQTGLVGASFSIDKKINNSHLTATATYVESPQHTGFSIEGRLEMAKKGGKKWIIEVEGRAGSFTDAQGELDYWFVKAGVVDDFVSNPAIFKPVGNTNICITGFEGGLGRHYNPLPREEGIQRLPGNGYLLTAGIYTRDCKKRGKTLKAKGTVLFTEPVSDGFFKMTLETIHFNRPNFTGYGELVVPYDASRITAFFQIDKDHQFTEVYDQVEAKGRIDLVWDLNASVATVTMRGRGRMLSFGEGWANHDARIDYGSNPSVSISWAGGVDWERDYSKSVLGSSASVEVSLDGEVGFGADTESATVNGYFELNGRVDVYVTVNYLLGSKTFHPFGASAGARGCFRAGGSNGAELDVCVHVDFKLGSTNVCVPVRVGSGC